MEEGTADGRQQRSGEHDAAGRRADAMIEDANSQRVQEEPVRAGIVAGDDDQIESSLISEFGAQNPDAMGSSFQQDSEAGMDDEASNHLFTDAMKLQLRAQILVLGDLLKGIAPNPDWLEDACLESAIGAESVLLSPNDVPRGAQDVRCENTCIDDDVPAESNLPRISPPFRDAEARIMSPFRDAGKDESLLHSVGRRFSTPGKEPSSSGKGLSSRDAEETGVALSGGQLLITYNHTPTERLSHPNEAEEDSQEGTENRMLESDKHLDLAQASAQDALTTATSALAQSHMVWARLHSQDHSEEGIARDARLASVAATVAAASSVAKAAVEAARAIAEVSMDAFIQAGGYQLGGIRARTPPFWSTRSRPLQVDGWEPSPYNNARENGTPSQQRAEMLESVVQAAGKAAEAATQAGAVLAKANPMIQNAGLSGFWSARKPDEADVEHEGNEGNEYNEINEANGMDAADEVDGFDGEVGALNETNELDHIQEEDDATCRDQLDAVNGDEMAVANGDEVVAANGVIGANEARVAAPNEDKFAAVTEVGAGNEDGVFGGANEVAEPFETEKRISPRSRKFKRGRGRSQGAFSRAKRSKVSSPPLPAEIPENAMHKKVDVSDVPDENARGKKRGAKHMETTPGEDTPATAPATQDPDNPMPKAVEVLESQKNVRDRNSRAQRRGTQSSEDEMHQQDDALKSQKNVVRGRKRGAKHIGATPVRGDASAGAPAQSPENEVDKQDDDALKGQKSIRGKKRGAKQIGNAPVRGDAPATAPTQSPENEVHKQDDDALKRQKNVRGKKRAAKHIEYAPVRGDAPAIAPAQSVENEVHKQDDAQTGRKNVRGKKRAAKHIETAPVSTSGEDIPANTALVQSPENEVHKKDEVLKSRRNVRGKKRGAKHVESTSVSTSGEDVLATALIQSPENEVHKEDDVPKIRKNVQDGNAKGRARGAKTLSTPGKDIADRHSRGAEIDANTLNKIPGCSVLEGSAVEVMIDEVGLRGGWFSGTVLRMIPNEVFVELHDLLTDDGKAHVREWFPLMEGFNPHYRRRHARPVHPFTIFNEAGSRKRRRVALGSQIWHIGDQVDAFVQDAWWEGIVAEMNDLDPTKATVHFPEENDTQLVKTWDLRPSFQWKENQWIPWKSPALVEDERPQKRPKPGDQNNDGPDELLTSPIPQEDVVRTMPEQQQGSKTSFQRSKWKKLNKKKNEILSQEESNPNNGPEEAHHPTTDVLAPGTSKKLDFTTTDDATVVRTTGSSAPRIDQGKAPLKKGKPTRRRKRYT